MDEFINLFSDNITDITKPIRLIGIGFKLKEAKNEPSQFDIFQYII